MLRTALKEWAFTVDLLLTGELSILLRKGGVHDVGGVFKLEHDRFTLFPSWTHQRPELVKPPFRERVPVFDAEPATFTMRGMAEVDRVWEVPSRAAFDRLDDLHPWSTAQIDLRFDYKPEKPLYLLLLRTSRLASPVTLENHAAYTGCRSWVPLRPGDEACDEGASAVLDASGVDRLRRRIDAAMRPESA